MTCDVTLMQGTATTSLAGFCLAGWLISGEQADQQVTQSNQVLDGGGYASGNHEVHMSLSLTKQRLGPRSWMSPRDRSSISNPLNIQGSVTYYFAYCMRIVYRRSCSRFFGHNQFSS